MVKSKIEIVIEYMKGYLVDIKDFTIEEIKNKNLIKKNYIDGTTIRILLFNISIPKDSNSLINISKFYEEFLEKLEKNNKERVLPLIKGIQNIKCISNLYLEKNNVYQIEMKIEYIMEE